MYSNFVSRAEFDHLKLKYDEVCAINVQLNGEIAKLKQIINNSTKPPEIYQQQNCPQSNAISINRNYNHQPMDNNGYKIEDFAVGVSGHFLATPGLRPNEPIKPVNCQDDDFTFDSVQSKFLKVELKFSDDEEIRIPQAGNQTKKTKKKKKDKGNKKAKRKKRGKKKSTAKRGEMKFECHLCKLNTPKYLSVLRRHMSLKHIGVKALTCDHCGRKFKQIGSLFIFEIFAINYIIIFLVKFTYRKFKCASYTHSYTDWGATFCV